MSKKRASVYLLCTLFLCLALTSHPAFSEETTPKTLFLTVYPDGFVFVDYTLLVDPTFPTQNITVFGQVLEDLLVVDGEGLPLSYSLNDSLIIVNSLGTDELSVSYLTQDLTSKDGRYWTLTIDAPVNAQIILPVQSTIISLNQVPELIETNGNKVQLLMNASLIEVTYVIGVVGTEEYAQIVLTDAEQKINEIKNFGINLAEAETKLQAAENAFSHGNFPEAETLGNEAINLAIFINQTANQAQTKLHEAEAAIVEAQHKERTSGLGDALSLLGQAHSAYDDGNYLEALNLATQAASKAEDSTSLASDNSDTFPFYGILGAILIPVGIVFVVFLVRSRKQPEIVETEKKTRQIDVERIFRAHKNLMPEEKQTIQFLADNNGEAFEADLFDYVKIPRTTMWRLVKRLEAMGIIKKSKFRRQNMIRVKNKYTIKD